MQAIQELATKLDALNVNQMLDEMFSKPKYQKLIPDMVRERLWEQGIYSTGKPIITYAAGLQFPYAYNTVFGTTEYRGKKDKGQPYDRVTLRDTGAFYTSFTLVPQTTYAVITYDENKEDGKVSDNVNLDNVFNLSDGEMKALRANVLVDFITMFKQKLSV